MSKAIWIIGETKNNDLSRSTRECLSEARRIGGTITCVLLGSHANSLAGAAGQQGADAVIAFEDKAFDAWSLELVAESVAASITAGKPDLVIIPATTHGKELVGKTWVDVARHGGLHALFR